MEPQRAADANNSSHMGPVDQWAQIFFHHSGESSASKRKIWIEIRTTEKWIRNSGNNFGTLIRISCRTRYESSASS